MSMDFLPDGWRPQAVDSGVEADKGGTGAHVRQKGVVVVAKVPGHGRSHLDQVFSPSKVDIMVLEKGRRGKQRERLQFSGIINRCA